MFKKYICIFVLLSISAMPSFALQAVCSGNARLNGLPWYYANEGWTLQTYDGGGIWCYNDPSDNDYFIIRGFAIPAGTQGRLIATKGLQIKYADFTMPNPWPYDGYLGDVDFVDYTQIPLGIHYFGGWTDDPKNMRINLPNTRLAIDTYIDNLGNMLMFEVDSFGYRQPLLGWYESQRVIDQQINWAAEAGVNFFAFDWYYPEYIKTQPSDTGLNNSLSWYLNSSAIGKQNLKFCIDYINHGYMEIGLCNQWNSSLNPIDEWNRYADYWVTLMKRADYLRVKINENEPAKPLFIIWSPTLLHSTWDSIGDSASHVIQVLRSKAVEAGLTDGIYVAGGWEQTAEYEKDIFVNDGYDIITGYSLNIIGYENDPTAYKTPWPYETLANGHVPIYEQIFDQILEYEQNWDVYIAYAPVITAGWDMRGHYMKYPDGYRPIVGDNETTTWAYYLHNFVDVTPGKFRVFCDTVKSWICKKVYNYKPGGSYLPGLVVYAWNEYGEGGYLAPNIREGYGYLDVLHDVFVNSQPLTHPENDYYVLGDGSAIQSYSANYAISAAGWNNSADPWTYIPQSFTIQNGAIINFDAGYAINLKPGFQALEGCNFHAYINESIVPTQGYILPANVSNNTGSPKGLPSGQKLPIKFELNQNYPNPISRETCIKYALPRSCKVCLKVYNSLGQLVKTVIDDEQNPGYYLAKWDGKDGAGRRVASGVYLYRLQAGDFTATKQLVLIR